MPAKAKVSQGLLRLANCTSHWQSPEDQAAFQELGFEVLPDPLLPHVEDAEDALRVASCAVREALSRRMDGVFVGGRTDLAVYTVLLAVPQGLRVFTPDVIHVGNRRFQRAMAYGSKLRALPELRLTSGVGVQVEQTS